MFGEVIGTVEGSFSPEDVELPLAHTVTYPIKPHVDGLGAFLFDAVSGNSDGGTIVSLNRGWWLGMPQFFERNT